MKTPPRADRPTLAIFRRWSQVYDHAVFQRGLFGRVHRALLSLLDDVPPPRTVVDLGCGTGLLTQTLTRRFAGASVVGLDLSLDMLRPARARAAVACANVYALPVAPGSVDLVVCSVSFHWYADPDRALAEIRAALAPGGRVALAVPTSHLLRVRALRGVIDRASGRRVRLGPPDELFDRLAASGFAVEQAAAVWPGMQLVVARRD